MATFSRGGNLFTTERELQAAGFTLVETSPNAQRQVWSNDPARLVAHRYTDGMTFGYELEGFVKVDADYELADYLELHQ